MKRNPAKQLTLVFSLTATVLVAAAVLLWGAEYKCSLYQGHRTKHARVAMAKLLSERERPVAERGERLRAPLPAVVFFAAGVLWFGRLRRTSVERIDAASGREAAAASRLRCVVHFSFRPPPRDVGPVFRT